MKRYALHPGWMKSSYDFQRHYVGYKQLIKIHGLNPAECFDATREIETIGLDWRCIAHFFPLVHGRYPQFPQQQENNS